MTALKVLGIILLILFLIGLIRVGGIVEYGEGGLGVWVRVGPLRFQIIPAREKKPKKEKKEKDKPKEEPKEEPQEKKGGPPGPLMEYISLACEAAGALLHKLRIDKLEVDLRWGAEDPAKAAMGYGYANAALGAVLPLIENSFEVKERNIGVGVDFDAKSPKVWALAALSFRIGQLVAFAAVYGIKFLKLYLENKPKKNSKKEAVNDG